MWSWWVVSNVMGLVCNGIIGVGGCGVGIVCSVLVIICISNLGLLV